MPLLEPLFPAVIASAIALLFGGALAHKLRDWPRFLEALAGYGLVPPRAATALAAGIVLAEVAIVTGMLFASSRTAALSLAALVLGVYALAMAVNLARGRVLADCGCGGFGGRQSLEWWMVRRNLALAAFALLATWPAARRGLAPAEIFVVLCATAAAAGLYLAHGTLAANRRLAVR